MCVLLEKGFVEVFIVTQIKFYTPIEQNLSYVLRIRSES
jgi:hypothetical protein